MTFTGLLLFIFIDILCQLAAIHFGTRQHARGFTVPITRQTSPNTFAAVRHPELIALYASALNHAFGQMLGLRGSHVLLPYVPLHRLRQHRENYYDCVPVLSDEHLSRESRKLTVMMQ